MSEHRDSTGGDIEIHLGEYFTIVRSHWWKIAGLSLAVGIATLLYMFTKPNIYRSSAEIMPVEENGKRDLTIGALASFGVQVGGATKVEDLDLLFKSNDLTVRVFTRHDHWKTLLGDAYDPATGKVKAKWLASLLSRKSEPAAPGDWSAIRAARDAMRINLNRRTGSLTLSFETTSPEESAAILTQYLEEAKSRLQEEAFTRAAQNKKFIEEQIGKTVDALTRDRLYALLGQEVEREMLARNREQFGFRIIDSPRVPDRKFRPRRGRGFILALFLSFFMGCVFFLVRGSAGTKKPRKSI